MYFFTRIVLISSIIYSLYAGEFQIHNQPNYLSIASNKNEDDPITISNFANNFATLLGLSSDETEKHEKPLFLSSRPFEIPSSTWLFHIEGLDCLSKSGVLLDDNGEFNIDSIHSKLYQTGNGESLSIGTIIIASESDLNNLEKTIQNEISQMSDKATIKYLVINCDDCKTDKAIEQLQKQLKPIIDRIIEKDPQTFAGTLTTKESAHVRRTRQASNTTNNITIATMYADEYPTMFNIFFWTSLTLGIIIISIVYVFLTLDPGQDTIIYRMTATRLKVD